MKRASITGLMMVLTLGAAAGCGGAGDELASRSESAVGGGYAFAIEGDDELERLDTMGVPLMGTILANKDRDLTGRKLTDLASGTSANEDDEDGSVLGNALRRLKAKVAAHVVTPYRASAPYVGTPYLLALFDVNFMKLHGRWADSLRASGYEVCSVDLGAINPVGACTLQEGVDDRGKKLGKVAEILVPDWLTVDVDDAAGFPNGRTPNDPVGDYILALGFLKMGGRCPGGPCNLKTFAQLKHADGSVGTNPPRNDRKTHAEFPYLATPWFYWAEGDRAYDRDAETLDVDACRGGTGECPYWPKGDRKKTPGPPGTKYAAPDAREPTVPTPAGEQ